MFKFYKFESLSLCQDKVNNSSPYKREGVVTNIDYETMLNKEIVEIMWKSPDNIAYNGTEFLKNINIIEISEEEYIQIINDIDFKNNNQFMKLFNDKKNELKTKSFQVINN